jgi:hypothetical protein
MSDFRSGTSTYTGRYVDLRAERAEAEADRLLSQVAILQSELDKLQQLLDKQLKITKLQAERDKLKDALFDLCDGNDWHDIKHATGFSDERCQEIIALASKEHKQ